MKKYLAMLSILALFCLAAIGSVWAEIPKTINYQGSLQNKADGTPVNGPLSMTFALYDSLTNGNLLWSDTMNVSVSNGIYSVVLGSSPGKALTLPFEKPYFLEVSAGGATLAPRQALTSVPYAMKAGGMEGVTVSNGRIGILTPSLDGGLLKVGDIAQGADASFMFKNNWFALSGTQGSDRYPYITYNDENGTQVMYLGYGSKQHKYLDFSLKHQHALQFRGNDDFIKISDFEAGTSMQIGQYQSTPSKPGFMRLRPVWSTRGLALTGSGNQMGVFVQASNGNVGIGKTDPFYKLDVAGKGRFMGDLEIKSPGAGIYGLQLQRTDEDNRSHSWRFWHMDYRYGKNSLQIYEYKTDSTGKSCGGSAADGAMCSPRMTIAEGGKVGIGTHAPQYKLDVAGTIRGSSVLPSDRRWKEEIATLDDSLGRVSQLRGVSFRWRDASRGEGPEIGVIAQEVEAVFPEAVSTDSEGYKSVSYEKLVAPLIEAVKTLNAENDALKARNDDLERRLDALEAIVNRKE